MKKFSLYIMAAFYAVAGINHFISTKWYLQIMPHRIPFQLYLIYLSGICETVFGVLLLPKITRRFAACGIIILLIAIFPANIQMMLDYWNEQNKYLWIAILRLPLQIVLIWWAYLFVSKKEADKI